MHHKNSTKHLRKLALSNKREAEKQSRNSPGCITKFFRAPAKRTASSLSAPSSQIAADTNLPSDNKIIEMPTRAPSASLISRLHNLTAKLSYTGEESEASMEAANIWLSVPLDKSSGLG